MSISIKTAREIEKMRRAGELLEKVHDELGRAIHPGMSTWEINKLGEEMIRSFGCTPNFLNYNGYPASICVSVNEEVVHGIPSKKRILKEGDIVSLDAGLIYEGYHSDAARTHAVGEISPEARKLVEVTRRAFFEGIKYAKAGHHLHEISAAIGAYAESFGYGVVRDLVGHGIGTHLHEDPAVPNFAQPSRGVRLQPGMTLAIEPMITAGGYAVRWLDDDWTVVTEDDSDYGGRTGNSDTFAYGGGFMKPIVKGMFARSLAGHDKGKLYVISDVQEPYVFLVDGKIRTANRPKKKKLIHVQPDYEMTDAVRDEDIRKALKEKSCKELKED